MKRMIKLVVIGCKIRQINNDQKMLIKKGITFIKSL